MKKISIILLLIAITFIGNAQTWSEISNILNSKPAPITSVNVSANSTNLAGTLNLMTIGYRAISFSVSGTWSAGIQLQGSNDTTVGWVKIQCATSTNFGTAWLDTITANGYFSALTTGFKYVRLRTITYSSGTINSVVIGYLGNINLPPPPSTLSVTATVTGGLDATDSLHLAEVSTNTARSTTGSAVPSSAIFIGGTDGTNVRAIKTTTGGLVQIDSNSTRTMPKQYSAGDTSSARTKGFAMMGRVKYAGGSYSDSLTELSVTEGTSYLRVTDIENGANISQIASNLNESLYPGFGTTLWDIADTSAVNTSAINAKIPSGLTVNSNRLAIYSPDSLKVWTPGGFGGGGGSGGAVTIDTTLYAKKVISLGTGGNTIGAISNTSFAVTNAGTFAVQNTPSASDSNKYRFLVGVQNMYSVLASDSTKYRKMISIDNFPSTYPVTGTFWQATQPVSFTRFKSSTDTITSSLDPVDSANLRIVSDWAGNYGVDMANDIFVIKGNTNDIKTKIDSLRVTNNRLDVNSKLSGQDSINLAGINTKLGGIITTSSDAVDSTNLSNIASAINQQAGGIGSTGISIMGSDGAKARQIKTTTSGEVYTKMVSVDSTNLAEINSKLSGTLTVTGAGGGTQYAEGATTAPATGTVALGRYQSSAPTLSNNALNAPMLDVNGNLKVNIVAGSSSGTQYVDNAAGSTPTGTVSMGQYNSSPPTYSNGDVSALQSDINGNLKATIVSSDLPIGAATESSLSQVAGDLHNSQGNSGSGVKGPLVQSLVNAAAPAYSDGEMRPQSMNARGALRTVLMNGSSEITSFGGGTQYADSSQTGTSTGTAMMGRVRTTAPSLTNGTLYIPTLTQKGEQAVLALPDTVSGRITTQNLSAFRTATAGSAVVLNVYGYTSAAVQVRGTYTGALTLQGTVDDSVWVTFGTSPFYRPATGGTASTITSADTNVHTFSTYNMKKIRITGLAAMTGTATVFISASTTPYQVIVSNTSAGPVAISGTVTSSGAKNEDAAAASGDGGVFVLSVRADTLTNGLTSANGDYSQLSVTKHGALLVKEELTHRVTYRATSGGFNAPASATDVATITGVASKTVMVTKIIVSATQTTGGTFDITLLKRSTANADGTAMTAVPLDAADAAAGASVKYYATNSSSLGSLVGNLDIQPVFCAATTGTTEHYTWDFGQRGKPITLNSASQNIGVNFGSGTMSGGRVYVTFEWVETW